MSHEESLNTLDYYIRRCPNISVGTTIGIYNGLCQLFKKVRISNVFDEDNTIICATYVFIYKKVIYSACVDFSDEIYIKKGATAYSFDFDDETICAVFETSGCYVDAIIDVIKNDFKKSKYQLELS